MTLHDSETSRTFVGRTEELRALRELLARAAHGQGSAAVVGGDAGVGKTRLCRELKAAAGVGQLRIIEGRCSPAETGIPYGPFIDALRFRLARGEGAEAADVLQPILAHVAPLFSGLASADQLEGRTADATSLPFERILGVLHRLAAHGPVLFVIEDVHWADPTSRDLIQFLARRIAALPMMLLATYRTDEIHAGHPVHRVVASIARERSALRVQLDPLSAAEVEELLHALLEAAPDRDFSAAVWRRTEGNPLFIEELVTVLRQAFPERAPHFAAADLAQVSIPSTVNEMVHERLVPLSADAREALLVGAVIGRRFPFDVLATALEWPEARLLPAVEQLVTRGFLHELPDEEGFAFRHSLVQEVMYASTIGRRRRLWHRRVAAALEADPASGELPHTTLAHHYSLGGEPEKARGHLVLGGDEAARLCAWKDAETMYEEALTIVERAGGAARIEADILERLAEVAWWQNRVSAVEQYSSEALAIRRRLEEHERAAALLRRLANLDAHQRGDFQRAVERLREALTLVSPDSSEAAVITNDMGRIKLARGQLTEAAALFEESLRLTSTRHDCAEEAFALVNLGWLAICEGSIAVGVQRLELARALIAEEEVPIDRGAEIYHAGLRALDAAREHRRAAGWADAAMLYAQEHAARGNLATYSAYRASIQRRAGNWESALNIANDAVDQLRSMQRAELREALRISGDVQRVRGLLDAAHQAYDEAIELGDTDAIIGKALLLAAEHRWPATAAVLQQELTRADPVNRLFAMRVLPILIEAHAATGAISDAQRELQRLAALVDDSDYPAGRPALLQARGITLAATGATAEAAAALQQACTAWQALQLPYESARATLLLARICLQRDDKERAARLAREAAQTFAQLQAGLDVAQAQSVLRQSGVRTRVRRAAPDLPPPFDQLTAREAEVLIELSRGRTNKQIAKTLSMSPKTVGNHVSSILTKLGCATRTEAARLLPPS